MALLLLLLMLFLRLVTSAGGAESFPATAIFVLGDSTGSCAATTLSLNLTSPSSFSSPCIFHSGRRRLLPDILGKHLERPRFTEPHELRS